MYEGTSNTDKGSKRGVQYTDSSFLYLVFIIRTYFKWGWELLRREFIRNIHVFFPESDKLVLCFITHKSTHNTRVYENVMQI